MQQEAGSSWCSPQYKNSDYLVLNVLEWNARLIKNKIKQGFQWFLINEISIDIAIVLETRLEEKIKLMKNKYEVIQTSSKFQRLWIIERKELQIRIENKELTQSWIMIGSIRINERITAYIIYVYMK